MFKVPTPPADNLYKFIAIFGLVIIIFGIYMWNTSQKDILEAASASNLDIRLLEIKYPEESKEPEYLIEKEKIMHNRESLSKEIKDTYPKKLKGYFYGSVFGMIMVFVGFSLWYWRTQRFQDIILKMEAVKIEREVLGKSTIVPEVKKESA